MSTELITAERALTLALDALLTALTQMSGGEPCPVCGGEGGLETRVAGDWVPCWLCGKTGRLPLLAPGICASCGRPCEVFHEMATTDGSHLVCLSVKYPGHAVGVFDLRSSPLQCAWPREAR